MEGHCSILYAEDLQHRQHFGDLQIENPCSYLPTRKEPPPKQKKLGWGTPRIVDWATRQYLLVVVLQPQNLTVSLPPFLHGVHPLAFFILSDLRSI